MDTIKRIILHFDLDAFFASVEERENPHFRGKPLVVGADPKEGKGRGVVSTANYEARTYGIHSAMPISEAWKRCPQAVFLPVNGKMYQDVSERIMEIAGKLSSIFEQVSLDEAYLDVSFLQEYGEAERIGRLLKEEVMRQERLSCTVGIGPNKMMAKIACQAAKPNGMLVVTEDHARAYLDPLDIRVIPGVGEKSAALLWRRGIRTVHDLQALSRDELEKIFGVRGRELYDHARGIDESPIEPEREVRSIGKEHTFESDTRDPETLLSAFDHLIEEVGAEVRGEHVSFRTITVTCRFQGFETHTKSKTIAVPSQEEDVLREEAMKLLLRFLTENLKPIRLIGVRVQIAR